MDKIKPFIRLFVLGLVMIAGQLKASHIAGGDLTVQHLGGCNYVITLNLFRDCDGITMSTAETVTVLNNCTGASQSLTLPLVNGSNGTEVSQLCPSQVNSSTCNGGTLPGMQQYTYRDTVCLDSTCNNLEMSWTTCCRNGAIVNIDTPASEDIIINAVYNPSGTLDNNTPTFTAQPIPYVCINQVINYNYGVVETDGDSLVFSLVPTLGTGIVYTAGYTGAVPIPGITIDPVTGQLNFTPTLLGNFVVVMQVEEYRDGILISTVRRDIQIVVINCPNNVPDPTAGTIDSLVTQGSVFQMGPYELELCETSGFTFSATFTDPDATDSLTYTSNIAQVLPGATVTESGSNPYTLTIDWVAPVGSAGTNTTFIVTISDQSCPVVGLQTFVYNINVTPRTSTNPDFTICQGDTATLTAEGGTLFNWSLLNGTPLGTGASLNVSPNVTTTYVVSSNLSSTCINGDTVTVTVAPDYALSLTSNAQSVCSQQPVQFNATPSVPGNYSYNWSPATGLDNDTIPNPVSSIVTPGTYTYTVVASSDLGCVRQDTISFTVTPFALPDVIATAALACIGDSVQLSALFNEYVPPLCVADSTPCANPIQTFEFNNGTQQNTATDYPAPYSNFYKNARHQYLYRASDLQAAGFTGGKITSLGFFATNLNASTLLYKSYTIKLGCISQPELGLFFETNLTQVYDPKDYTVSLGWNDHQFDRAYNWDGISNLVVEVCFDNLSDPTYTQNVSTLFSTTNYNANLFFISDITPACPATSPTGNNGLPNIRFSYCYMEPSLNDFSVVWSPATFLDNSSIFTPVVLPGSTDSTFSVVVTNVAGGCSDADTITVQFTTLFQPQITQADTVFCANEGLQQLTAAQPGGTWVGPFITPSGEFDPTAAGNGTFTVSYQLGVGTSCFNADSVELVVSAAPNAAINPPGTTTFCPGDPALQLTALNPGGSWSGPGTSAQGLFDPATAGAGVHTIFYVIPQPCPDSASVTLTVNAAPTVTITPVPNLCITDAAVNLNVTVIPFNVGAWSGPGVDAVNATFTPVLAGPGTHTISYDVTDPISGCQTIETITIQVSNLPNASVNIPTDTTYCSIEPPFNLTPVTPNGTFTSSPAGAISVGGVFTPSLADTGRVIIQYTINVGGCTASSQFALYVYPTPTTPSVIVSDTVCEGVFLTGVTGIPSLATSTLGWYRGNSTTPDLLVNTGNVLNPVFSTSGTVYLFEISDKGCLGPSLEVPLFFYPRPNLSITANPTQGDAPLEVAFTSTSSTVNVNTFLWNFDDGGATSNAQNPLYLFEDSGTYNVQLIGTSADGCLDTARVDVFVEQIVEKIIPNIFTPNGDAGNNTFRFQVRASDFSSFNAIIFDRWGKKIIEFTSADDFWDGGDYPAGTYYYIIDATLKKDGSKFTPASGFFKLMR